MHELGIMQELLEIAQEQARQHQAHQIHALTVRIGTLAGVEPEALSFAFDVATVGTLAEGATLTIESVTVRCRCDHCAQDFEPTGFVFACPVCGRISSRILRGRELELVKLEVT